ncbi:MAG: GspE/PulE family protein [Candidatus Paceibacterota bacterium]
MTIQFDEEKQKRNLNELLAEEEEQSAQILSQKYGVKYVDLSGIPINSDALRLIPEPEARENEMAAFKIVGKKLYVAVRAPNKDSVLEIIDKLKEKDYTIELYMTARQSLEKAWQRYKDLSFAMETKAGTLDISNEEVEAFLKKVNSLDDIEALINENVDSNKVYRTSKILAIIIAGGVSTDASDIHIEPEEKIVRLRYRLDGSLVELLQFDKETYQLLLSRIKLLSGLKLNIKENSQDGRFSVKVYNQSIEIRTSTLPGAFGESVVLRILNPKSIQFPLKDLGIPPKLLDLFVREISKPNGMILTTGPTGSGKTTTLYAFLRRVHNPSIKVVTIEDPVEYHLDGIVQTQVEVEKGYTFAAGLRSTLRQDPDVIMVGEIRDNETAEIAVHAALTGHLVFSTLHTNNAAGAFPRLIDLGVNPKILVSAINLAIAQRLLRKLCLTCRKQVPVPENKKAALEIIWAKLEKKGAKVSQKDFVFEAVGCPECNKTGYKGRIGIYEAIMIDRAVEDTIQSNPSEREIVAAAEPQNILSLAQDGLLKVADGVTSLVELESIVDMSFELPENFDYAPPEIGDGEVAK